MEYIILSIILVILIFASRIVFKINLKEVKNFEKNEEIQKLTDKYPENIEIAREMLKSIHNEKVKVEENPDEKSGTSLYIAITDKISIAKMKNNYARIQTIAHECMHSLQDRRLLLFNFIFSNIYLLYFVIGIIFILFQIGHYSIYLYILMLMAFFQFSVRAYLEIDAMTKAKFLADSYMKKKNVLSDDERNKVIDRYEKINKIGIPFVIQNLMNSHLIKFLIYTVIISIKMYLK